MPTDPVTIYKDGKQKSIAAVDLAGWVVDGWSATITVPEIEEIEKIQPPEIDVAEPPKPTKVKLPKVTEEKSIELEK